jgi:hypothetical protein
VNADVDVRDGNPVFEVTHEKSMAVDDRIAYVKSLNWVHQGVHGEWAGALVRIINGTQHSLTENGVVGVLE